MLTLKEQISMTFRPEYKHHPILEMYKHSKKFSDDYDFGNVFLAAHKAVSDPKQASDLSSSLQNIPVWITHRYEESFSRLIGAYAEKELSDPAIVKTLQSINNVIRSENKKATRPVKIKLQALQMYVKEAMVYPWTQYD